MTLPQTGCSPASTEHLGLKFSFQMEAGEVKLTAQGKPGRWHMNRQLAHKLKMLELFSVCVTGASVIRCVGHLFSRYHLGIELGMFTLHAMSMLHGLSW